MDRSIHLGTMKLTTLLIALTLLALCVCGFYLARISHNTQVLVDRTPEDDFSRSIERSLAPGEPLNMKYDPRLSEAEQKLVDALPGPKSQSKQPQ
jgi:hypothetical protein